MRLLTLACLCVSALFAAAGVAAAEDATPYMPAKGNEVVIYTHHFNAEDFAAGLKLVEDGFTAAQSKSGQTRYNYFLINPTTYDVVVVSFFGPKESVDEWHRSMGRLDVLKQLAPMRRTPLELQRFTLDTITTSP